MYHGIRQFASSSVNIYHHLDSLSLDLREMLNVAFDASLDLLID
jgi:hypothetical protein